MPRLVCQLAVDAVSQTHVFHAIRRDALEIADRPPMSHVRAVAGLGSAAQRGSEVVKGYALLVTPIGPHVHCVHNIACIVLAKIQRPRRFDSENPRALTYKRQVEL